MSATLVLPGDSVAQSSTSPLTLGPGIGSSSSRASTSGTRAQSLVASKAGILSSASAKGKEKEKGQSLWIEGSSRRYIAAPKDLVLGTIIARHSEGYRVDLGCSQMASLDALAFEGATKRSKPNLKIGTLVYARVTIANRDMEPEVECVDPATGKADGFGELKEGFVVNASLQLCRQLLNPKNLLLHTLAGQIPFEIAVGLNGRIWFKSPSVSETIALKRVIEGVEDGSIGTERKEVERALKTFLA